MKLTVDRGALTSAVAWTARALPARASNPAMTGLLLDASDALQLSAFNYEISGRTTVVADVEAPGSVLVSGKMLAEIVRTLPAYPVEISTDGPRVRIACGPSRFTLSKMALDDYSTLPKMPVTIGTVDAALFAQAVAQVAVAASREESPPILTGVQVEVDGGDLTMMATDRYRLAMRTIPWRPSISGMQVSALLGAKTLTEVAKAFGGGDVTLALEADGKGGLIGFEEGGRRSTSLLMDGQYPRVRSLFPKESPSHAVVEVQALVEAVRRVSLVVERHTAARLEFTADGLTVAGGQGEDAQASEAVEAVLSGDPITQGVNPQYLLDGLGALSDRYVRFDFTVAGKPVVLSSQPDVSTAGDGSYRYLLMPMRL